MRACFDRSTWRPAMNMQPPFLGTSHLILVDRLVRVLRNPGKIVDGIILTGISNVSRSSDSDEAQREAMLMCLFSAVWQMFQ